jgi:NADPH-dependent curcumin reductase CurA
MEGFIVFDYEKQYPEARQELARWLEEGKLKRNATIVQGGILKAEEALLGLFQGKNTGESCLVKSTSFVLC